MTTSTKPYLLRALYDWCLDNQQTPHIVAWVNEHTQVPMQYVRDNEIVLNIGPTASHHLVIDNEWVNFSARFGGVAHEIWIPVGHVISIFSRESGEGMGFELQKYHIRNNKGEVNYLQTNIKNDIKEERILTKEGVVSTNHLPRGNKKKLKLIK